MICAALFLTTRHSIVKTTPYKLSYCAMAEKAHRRNQKAHDTVGVIEAFLSTKYPSA